MKDPDTKLPLPKRPRPMSPLLAVVLGGVLVVDFLISLLLFGSASAELSGGKLGLLILYTAGLLIVTLAIIAAPVYFIMRRERKRRRPQG